LALEDNHTCATGPMAYPDFGASFGAKEKFSVRQLEPRAVVELKSSNQMRPKSTTGSVARRAIVELVLDFATPVLSIGLFASFYQCIKFFSLGNLQYSVSTAIVVLSLLIALVSVLRTKRFLNADFGKAK